MAVAPNAFGVPAAELKIAGDTPATTEEAMLYMEIERFKEGAAVQKEDQASVW